MDQTPDTTPDATPGATSHAGCDEFERASRVSRRGFVTGLAAATGVAVTTKTFGDAVMQASYGATTPSVLVVLSFRGGIDGLGMVVPYGDTHYASTRGHLAVSSGSLLARDGMFGLHPNMSPLLPLWNANRMAAVHAVGMAVPNRSHFQAIELIEDSDPGSSARTGWINRMIGTDGISAPQEAVHLSSPLTPTSFRGDAPTLSTDGFDNLQIPGLYGRFVTRRYSGAYRNWNRDQSPLGQAARSALGVSRGLATTMERPYRPSYGAVYPRSLWGASGLCDALEDAAHLIRAQVGTSVISIDFGSWDMHADYGTQGSGLMQGMVKAFAASVAAFFKDLGEGWGNHVTLATISEFGRRVAPNGNQGLDHGWGNMMLVMGAGVRGGRYYGQWPGLAPANLNSGDLAVTTDYRQVLAEVVAKRFPERSLSEVFPGFTPNPIGIMA